MELETVALVAIKAFTYAGKPIKPHETFDAPLKDANLLKLIGSAKDAPNRRIYRRRDLKAEA